MENCGRFLGFVIEALTLSTALINASSGQLIVAALVVSSKETHDTIQTNDDI